MSENTDKQSEELSTTLKGLVPTPSGSGVFLEAEGKIIAIFIDASVAAMIHMLLQDIPRPRPFTHDLTTHILTGFGIRVQKVVINDLVEDTFYARILLHQDSELGTSLLEVDARPSDAMTLALHQDAPICIARSVLEQAEDMAWALEQQGKTDTDESDPGPQTGELF